MEEKVEKPKVLAEKTVDGDIEVDGGEIPDVYVNKELAEKLNAISAEDIENRATDKFGSLYAAIRDMGDVVDFIKKKCPESVVDQLDVVAVAIAVMVAFPFEGIDLRNEFALFQVYLCKRTGVKMEGVLPWENFFYTEKEEAEAVEAAESNAG
jgi:hypothetical protein